MRAFARWISPQPLAAKVPQIGLLFWVVKLLTTAGGEAASDLLVAAGFPATSIKTERFGPN